MTSLRHKDATRQESPAPASAPPGTGAGTKDAYLDAARACILDVGWRRTTLTEVARRAGVSRMTIYRSWADMPQLLGDLMTREWAAVVAATLASEPDEGDDVDRLVHALISIVRALRDNELFVRIVELDPELLLPYLLSRRGRSQQAVLSLLAARIEAGQHAGEVVDGHPVVVARTLVLGAHGFVLSAHTMVDDDVSLDDLDAEWSRQLGRGLRR